MVGALKAWSEKVKIEISSQIIATSKKRPSKPDKLGIKLERLGAKKDLFFIWHLTLNRNMNKN
ncbi:MAG: hypothetical protein LBE38_06195 [Deltaproteobacteria bacterium]|nr:hypothetical protein [Deltaproteobacteria bacterium]